MDDIEKALRLKNLGNDPAFQELLTDVKADQMVVFSSAGSSMADREEAHAVIRAVAKIEGRVQSAINVLAINERKGKDRNGD